MEKIEAEEMQEDVEDSSGDQMSESAGGDVLEYDESAYVMYHRAQTGLSDLWLVLSYDCHIRESSAQSQLRLRFCTTLFVVFTGDIYVISIHFSGCLNRMRKKKLWTDRSQAV